jgi:predicted MFS family arabinose efflux permease
MWVIAGCSLVVLLATRVLLADQTTAARPSFAGFKEAAKLPAVQRTWLRTLLYFIAIFSVFGYIGPVLTSLNTMPPGALAVTLAVFGLAGIAGTLMGGWANDRFGPIAAMRVQLSVLCTTMVVLPFTQGSLAFTLVVLVIWGVAGFGMMAPQQSRLAGLAPAQAPLLLSLNASMLYGGTALGTLVSGALISSVSFTQLSWVGLPFALVALVTLAFDSGQKAMSAIPASLSQAE